jgi:predicted O-methyltransferase YrrM
MEFFPEDINEYVEHHTSDENELLKKINRETHSQVLMPRMLSGHLQGRILSMISKMIQPEKILEIGTYTGYSALCLAEGLADNGKLITIDVNEELEDRVRKYFSESPYDSRIQFIIGNALEEIPEIEGPVDLVFIDADKVNYSNYFNLVFEKVRSGGLIIADNVLWSGKVVESRRKKLDEDTQALIEFNTMIQKHEHVENVLFPVRDGLMVIRKK